MKKNNRIVAVVGMGYVGLPLALAFSKKYTVIGFDTDTDRVNNLKNNIDNNDEITNLAEAVNKNNLRFSASIKELAQADIYIVAVPTPVDAENKPDLACLKSACSSIGPLLDSRNLVIFESTVYPGATEEVCIPILEKESGLELNKDFYVGYSPERISPGAKGKQLEEIIKVTSGSCDDAAKKVDELYRDIIPAGTHLAPSIKVAEACKIIENVQRDVNIALINEFALIFDKLDIDTQDVLTAARSKWNFLDFRPGMVGGHCICVDPYYFTHQADSIGHHPDILVDARKINDSIPAFIAQKIVHLMKEKGIDTASASILILGATFKENCADLRNTGVKPLAEFLTASGLAVDIVDPVCRRDEAEAYFQRGIYHSISDCEGKTYDGLVLATPHDAFTKLDLAEFEKLLKTQHLVFDIKGMWPKSFVDGRL